MALKATPSAIASVWAIEDILEGPKSEVVNGKKKKYYKVKWRLVESLQRLFVDLKKLSNTR
jgi:hypothetical protein